MLLSLYANHLFQTELVDVGVFIQLEFLLHQTLELLRVEQLVNELGLNVILLVGKRHDAVVDKLVDGLCGQFAAFGNVLQHAIPYALHVCHALLAVFRTHVLACLRLYVALVFAYSYCLVLDAKLLQQSSVVFSLHSKTFQVNHTRLVQVELVGNGSQPIGHLGVFVTIGNDPLAAFLEVCQRVAHCLHGGVRVE